MSIRIVLISLLLFNWHNSFVLISAWSYNDQDIWSQDNPECGGMQQSPININTNNTTINSTLKIKFYGYQNQISNFQGVNNGHSIQINYSGDANSAPIISGTALNNMNYILAQFHFHWGLQNDQGSEHTIDGKRYSLELHLVHYDQRRFGSFQEAQKAQQGTVVLAIFFQIENQNNSNIDGIISLVNMLKEQDGDISVMPSVPLVLEGLLPQSNKLGHFYRYTGSLTTPPCTQGVTWLVMAEPNVIGINQIEVLRKVKDVQNNTLVGDNFRKSQALNDRVVEASFVPSSASISHLNIVSLVFCLLSFYIFNISSTRVGV